MFVYEYTKLFLYSLSIRIPIFLPIALFYARILTFLFHGDSLSLSFTCVFWCLSLLCYGICRCSPGRESLLFHVCPIITVFHPHHHRSRNNIIIERERAKIESWQGEVAWGVHSSTRAQLQSRTSTRSTNIVHHHHHRPTEEFSQPSRGKPFFNNKY